MPDGNAFVLTRSNDRGRRRASVATRSRAGGQGGRPRRSGDKSRRHSRAPVAEDELRQREQGRGPAAHPIGLERYDLAGWSRASHVEVPAAMGFIEEPPDARLNSNHRIQNGLATPRRWHIGSPVWLPGLRQRTLTCGNVEAALPTRSATSRASADDKRLELPGCHSTVIPACCVNRFVNQRLGPFSRSQVRKEARAEVRGRAPEIRRSEERAGRAVVCSGLSIQIRLGHV